MDENSLQANSMSTTCQQLELNPQLQGHHSCIALSTQYI
jgi:hypothetical protein